MTLSTQIFFLFVLAIPIACASWTVTHEEVFAEFRAFCAKRFHKRSPLFARKFFYLFTCEYCFSHYVTIFFLFLTRFTMLLPDWRGYIISFFALVFVANVYMSFFGLLRMDIKSERAHAKLEEKKEAALSGK